MIKNPQNKDIKLMREPDWMLTRLVEKEFIDLEEMCAELLSWQLDFRPLLRVKPGTTVARIVQTRCGSIEFTHARITASIDQMGEPPAQRLTFVIMEKNMRRLWWRGHDVDGDTLLVFPLNSELKSLTGPDFNVHTVSVDEHTVAGTCEHLNIPFPVARWRPEVVRVRSGILDRLRISLRQMHDRMAPSPIAKARECLETIVTIWLRSANERAHRLGSFRSRDLAVGRSLEFLEAEGPAEVSAARLCQIAGVSSRTLEYAFRERFDLSPAAYLKALRLSGVRRALMNAREQAASVGDISAQFGFWHVGQFAKDYRQMFGELPSVTLGRARLK